MLSDFLLLEEYYNGPETARFYEDLLRNYGIRPVQAALRAGHIAFHCVRCGPNSGRLMFCLTEEGRRQAVLAPAAGM